MALTGMKHGAHQIRPHTFGGNGLSSQIKVGIEDAAQSFKKGALLINNGGSLAIATSDNSGTGASAATTDVIGVAAGPASGVTGKAVPYYPINADMEFSGCVNGLAGATSEVKADDVNKAFGLAVHADTDGVFYINKQQDTADNANVRILGLLDPVDTQFGRLIFKFTVRSTDNIW